ncbi:TetR/AcrR family transcriptional regulator [Streptomyces soliscabiei]|uniref:TetR/AcrR family transcriptional regulator n=1 Tax=Streptomyces soliscabiei TaxID=588897 RepID=UPI0029B5EFDD|nr:TetR family transcriptional regulator [Streptomyces sp. NY05-11A]MDX2676677.1 TetR family transcriptional regulator [Streptomyces sp. NY05-11A]
MAKAPARRSPAAPTAQSQVVRRARILTAAAELGAVHGYDGVQMQAVAKEAGVALGTLYRYFPSKTQLFMAVMSEEVFGGRGRTGNRGDAELAGDVVDLLVGWTRRFARRPKLALVMVRSVLATYSSESAQAHDIDVLVAPQILGRLGIEQPTEEDLNKVRLLTFAWWGIVMSRLSDHMTQAQAEDHIRLGTTLVFAPTSGTA